MVSRHSRTGAAAVGTPPAPVHGSVDGPVEASLPRCALLSAARSRYGSSPLDPPSIACEIRRRAVGSEAPRRAKDGAATAVDGYEVKEESHFRDAASATMKDGVLDVVVSPKAHAATKKVPGEGRAVVSKGSSGWLEADRGDKGGRP